MRLPKKGVVAGVAMGLVLVIIASLYLLYPITSPVVVIKSGTYCQVDGTLGSACIIELKDNQNNENLTVLTVDINGVRQSLWVNVPYCSSIVIDCLMPVPHAPDAVPLEPNQTARFSIGWTFGDGDVRNLTVGQPVSISLIISNGENLTSMVLAEECSGQACV